MSNNKYLYHNLSINSTYEKLKSSKEGISEFDAKERLEKFGTNELPEDDKFSWIMVLWRQFANPLVFIILVAGIVSFFIKHYSDAFLILIVIIVNAILGFLQEYKAQNALSSLKKTIKLHATVIRNGKKGIIESKNIVPGDVLVVKAGDSIPADGRLFEIDEFFVNESVLTGESEEVKKNINKCTEKTSLGDRKNMVFAGSHVTNGEAKFVVTATGKNSEIGKIAKLVEQEEEAQEPLKKKFKILSRQIGATALFFVFILAAFSFYKGQSFEEIFITSTALIVSIIPEGLLPAVTIVMIFGVRRLLKQKALVRRLASTETIGAITVICTDKTGTLTKGEMSASFVLTGGGKLFKCKKYKNIPKKDIPLEFLKTVEIGGLVNNAFIESGSKDTSQIKFQGRPTDKALLSAAVDSQIDFSKNKNIISRIPFSSTRKFAANIFKNTDKKTALMYVVGAPEVILDKSSKVNIGNNANINLSLDTRKNLEEKLELLTNNGLRVVACAKREVNSRNIIDSGLNLADGFTLIGFIALKDPVRDEVKFALKKASRAGIRPVIITGDNAKTTKAIVADLNWEVSDKEIMLGKEIDEISQKELEEKVNKISIFARVAPKHKIRIVHALQKNDEIVAMVGDGVNDAPAIKAAHVGIGMGNGTDITKQTADIVLLDSSFSTIISAIEQGRVIFDNIRRIVIFLLADDFSELVLFLTALFFGFPLPLVAAQILWINLVEDSLPNIALTTERDTDGIMDVPPRKPNEPILSAPYKKFMFVIFIVSSLAAITFFVSMVKLNQDIKFVRTMTFVLVAFDSLAMVYVLKSFRRSIFRKATFDNKLINYSIIISLSLLSITLYVEPLSQMLSTVSLSFYNWSVIILITFIEICVLEFAKKKIFANKK